MEWYRLAAEAAPGALLYLNDLHILVGDYTDHKNKFEATVRFLKESGAPLGALGFQGHFHWEQDKAGRDSPKETADVLRALDKWRSELVRSADRWSKARQAIDTPVIR